MQQKKWISGEEGLQWLPAWQIRVMSLAKQQSQQSQDRQAGSQGPGRVMAYTLGFLTGSGLLPLTEIEGKEILESIHHITVR